MTLLISPFSRSIQRMDQLLSTRYLTILEIMPLSRETSLIRLRGRRVARHGLDFSTQAQEQRSRRPGPR